MKIMASTIQALLQEKHAEDVFVPECKNGPSNGGYLRMDAWAMKKSWSKPVTIGYEIKVSRQDFLKDDKWPGYMAYCSQFYFVCPPGLIKPEELPSDVGLMYITKTGTRLFTKRKAVNRDVEIPESLFRYILMARARIGPDFRLEPKGREYWARWLAKKDEDKELGYNVSRKIGELMMQRVDHVERKNIRLQNDIEKLENIKSRMQELGFNPDAPVHEWGVNKKLEDLRSDLPDAFARNIKSLHGEIEKLMEALNI